MKDIELDFINKKMKNKYVDDQDRIAQHIKVAVRSWLGDFFINNQFGVDYDNCWGDKALMKSLIVNQIEQIEGVFSVNNATISNKKDSENNVVFEFSAIVSIDNGYINISEVIGERTDGYSI